MKKYDENQVLYVKNTITIVSSMCVHRIMICESEKKVETNKGTTKSFLNH